MSFRSRRNRTLVAASLLAVPALVGAGTTAQAATLAGGFSTRCANGIGLCAYQFSHPTSGAVSVTVKKAAVTYRTYSWAIKTSSGTTVCSGSYRADGAAHTKTCSIVPAGTLAFTTPAADGPTDIVIRF